MVDKQNKIKCERIGSEIKYYYCKEKNIREILSLSNMNASKINVSDVSGTPPFVTAFLDAKYLLSLPRWVLKNILPFLSF